MKNVTRLFDAVQPYTVPYASDAESILAQKNRRGGGGGGAEREREKVGIQNPSSFLCTSAIFTILFSAQQYGSGINHRFERGKSLFHVLQMPVCSPRARG